MKKTLALLVPVLVLALLLGGWLLGGNQEKHGMQTPPLSLEVANVQQVTLPTYLEATGQVVSSHSVAVRPQVSGKLTEVHFREGTAVQKGELLFVIDPAPFAASLLGAKAAWQSADANARRTESLLKQKFVTEQEVENARAAADKALADYKLAEINLSYARITAPIAGRTGLVAVKSGNLVSVGDATPLVTINQMSPIDVQFSLPQQYLAKLRAAGDGLRVLALDETATQTLAEGRLDFVGNEVDAGTGTLVLKASFPNTQETLWPGEFVSVRLILSEEPELVMPAAALQTGQSGNFVYQVRDGKSVITPIKLRREQGTLAVLASGLAAGDTVVVRAPRNLRAGMPVQTRAAKTEQAEPQSP